MERNLSLSFARSLPNTGTSPTPKKRLLDQPQILLHTILELERKPATLNAAQTARKVAQLEQRLFQAVGESAREEAQTILNIGRLSWRLRDDDNLLLSRLESQLLRAVNEGRMRLEEQGRIDGMGELGTAIAAQVAAALSDAQQRLRLVQPTRKQQAHTANQQQEVRQLYGQPAAPGFASGRARRVASIEDLRAFHQGEILVCDAIQPMMTHLVPLAAAIVERRGGMLIHGAIIARELGIPCVNGVAHLTSSIQNGDLLAVDGSLGLITIGEAEFRLEREQGQT